MDTNPVPLIKDSSEITTEWIRQALEVGGVSIASDIVAVEVERL